MAAFAFDPESLAGGGGEGGAVGLGAAVTIGGGQMEAEGGFAGTGLAGEDGEEAGGQPAGPVPVDGHKALGQVGPGGANGGIEAKFGRDRFYQDLGFFYCFHDLTTSWSVRN